VTHTYIICALQFCYPHQPFEVKLALALYSWCIYACLLVSAAEFRYRFFFYIDDRGCEIPVESYQQRLVLGLPSEDPALAHYSETLGTLYNHWDPVCANLMVCSVFDFVNGNILENMPEVNAMTVRRSATNWPTYFRSKTGMAGGFALGIFPKHAHPELTAYIQAIPDIETYQCLANDLLSFVFRLISIRATLIDRRLPPDFTKKNWRGRPRIMCTIVLRPRECTPGLF
jgi:hypothetical protein